MSVGQDWVTKKRPLSNETYCCPGLVETPLILSRLFEFIAHTGGKLSTTPNILTRASAGL